MAFAGNEDGVAGGGFTQGGMNRAGAVRFHAVRLRHIHARDNLRDNGVGVFVARVVAGDDDAMGNGRCGRAHEGAFVGIAIAPATKHTNELAGRGFAQGRQLSLIHI